jgi:metal-responsive CopG/Arc/MetJ family transcriptional regulator
MATTVQVDKTLLDQAKALTGFPSKSETINEALREFIRVRQKQQLLNLQGQIEFYDDFDPKSLHRKKV